MSDKSYSKVDSNKTVEEFWKNVFQNEMKYKDYYYGPENKIENLTEVEQEIFYSYLFDNKDINQILREWNSNKETVESENERLQQLMSKLPIKDVVSKDEFAKFRVKDDGKDKTFNDKLSKKVNEYIEFVTKNEILVLISQDFTTQTIRLTDFLPAVFLLCMTFQKREDLSFGSGTFINSF